MDYGAHLATLIAVIVGLAVTDLLAGASRTLRRTAQPEFSWLPFAQALMVAALLLVFWLASYAGLSSGKYLTVWGFASQLVVPALLYFAATRVFPPAEDYGKSSVRTYVAANARDVNVPAAIWTAVTAVENILFVWPNWRAAVAPSSLCVVSSITLLTAAFTHRDGIRWAATLVTMAIILFFMVMLLPGAPLN